MENIRDFEIYPLILKKLEYFYLKLIKRQINTGKPISIFIHPHLVRTDVENFLGPIFQKMRERQIPFLTLRDFARWWQKRRKLKLIYRLRNKKIEIVTDKKVLVEVIFQNKRKIIEVNKNLTLTGRKNYERIADFES